MVPVEVVNTHVGLMDIGQVLILATLGSMLTAGFVFIIRQIVNLQRLLDERLTISEYEKRHMDLERRLALKIDSIDHDSRDIFKEHGSRLRFLELWAAKKNNPEFN